MKDHCETDQLELCRRYGVSPVAIAPGDKLGIALNVRSGLLPINGVRTRPEGGTCGWYIWAGERMSQAQDFFQPLHVEHLVEWCEPAMRFLLLPPGWRFLIAGDHVDAWFDPEVAGSA